MDTTMSELKSLLVKEKSTLAKVQAELPREEALAWEAEIAAIEITMKLLKEQRERELIVKML